MIVNNVAVTPDFDMTNTTGPLEVASTRGQHLCLPSSLITIRCEQHLHCEYNGWLFRVQGITHTKEVTRLQTLRRTLRDLHIIRRTHEDER